MAPTTALGCCPSNGGLAFRQGPLAGGFTEAVRFGDNGPGAGGLLRRLQTIDLALLATLLPIWLVCFALHVREVVRTGYALPPVFVAPGTGGDEYPRVAGLRPETFVPQPGLEIGDRLLRAGSTDLRGVGYAGFYGVVLEQAGPDLVVPIELERSGERTVVELRLSRAPVPWVRIPGLLAIAATAVIVLLRAAQAAQARRFFAAFMLFLILETPFDGPSLAQTYLSQTVQNASSGLATALLLRWAILFPEEVSARGRIAPGWAWLAAPLEYTRLMYLVGGPFPPRLLPPLMYGIDLLILVAFLGALTWNYHRAEPIGRRRIKWVVYGAYVGSLSLLLTAAAGTFFQARPWVEAAYWLGALAFPLMPIAMLIAAVRYNLFDIDRLISATVSYNVLLVIFAGVAMAVVPRVAQSASLAVGIDPSAGGLVLSLLLASLVVPAQRRLRPQIDRLFFPEAHRLEEGIADLIVELSACEQPRAAVQRAAERIQELLRPETCVVYLKDGSSYAPVFVQGRETPEAFADGDPLAAVLRRHRAPYALEGASSRHRPGSHSEAFDRLALETLGAAAVVPLHRGADFAGALCLGRKRSGDIYSPTELALLMAVAEKLSGGALAGGDSSERSPAPAERAAESGARSSGVVTILFTDLVASTPLMQRVGDEHAQHIFEALREQLERAVSSAQGDVLQWLGDGLMASFASTADAVRCAIAIQQSTAEPIEGERLQMRVGLNVGETLRQTSGSGPFGIAIVPARRLCDRAKGGQILCSQAVADVLKGRHSYRFHNLGQWELKGVETPIGVCEVVFANEGPEPAAQ